LVITSGLRLEVVMGRRRRVKKSDGGELEINRQDVDASDDAFLLPSVVASDAGGAQQNVNTSDVGGAQQNVNTSDARGAQREVPNKMLVH
jgi:hypothetical protein